MIIIRASDIIAIGIAAFVALDSIGASFAARIFLATFAVLSTMTERLGGVVTEFTIQWRQRKPAVDEEGDMPPDDDPDGGEEVPGPPRLKLVGGSKVA